MIDQAKKDILGVLTEISNSMLRIKSEREYIKEAIDAAAEKSDMNKRILRKMAKVYHNNSFTYEVTEMEEFQALYESVVII